MNGTAECLPVLVVGAGGIGCELLKNLVYNGFDNITIVDLDTIDISNLNRQFLFHKKHVGRSKAETARENVLAFKPTANIVAYHKSIFSSTFNSTFFGKFAVVFNALDNLAARKHVNRMCVSAKIPLIESGTAGYLGQVEPLLPAIQLDDESTNLDGKLSDNLSAYRTGCYECQPRGLGQRHYPACTIRNTPSEPVHCVVWAKYLFNQLFGQSDVDDEDISPDFSDPDLHNHDHNNNINNNNDHSQIEEKLPTNSPTNDTHNSEVKKPNQLTLREWFRQLSSSHSNSTDTGFPSSPASSLAWRLFHRDIVTLVGMRDLWVDRQDRREPTPLEMSTLKEAIINHDSALSCTSLDSSNSNELRDQRKLSTSSWLEIFLNSVEKLQRQVEDGSGDKFLVWDKDDQEAMDFVASAAVIRSQLFHLPGADQLTRFTIKSLAGNIIPAVASTNAIVAGLMVLQARHILSKHYERVRTVYLHRQPTGRRGNRRLVVPVKPAPLNPSCLVCSDTIKNSQLRLVCSPETLTLRILRDHILIRHLGMLAPDVELSDRGVILISSEEGETDEDTLNKTLAEFNITQDTCLQCDDFRQDFTLRLIVSCISVESASPLSKSSDNNRPTQQQQQQYQLFDSDDHQSEQWRILGNVDSVLTTIKGGSSNSTAKLPSIPEEIVMVNGNEEKHKASLNRKDGVDTSVNEDKDTDLDIIEVIEESTDLPRSPSSSEGQVSKDSVKRQFQTDESTGNNCQIKKARLDTSDVHDDDSLLSSSLSAVVPIVNVDSDDDDDLILIELPASNLDELRSKLQCSLIRAQGVQLEPTIIQRFIEVFTQIVDENPPVKLPADYELEQCIGCMVHQANVTLNRQCETSQTSSTSSPPAQAPINNNNNNNQSESGNQCGICYCRPLWCLECLIRWFASRQTNNHRPPNQWLSGRVPCPTCRTYFCARDVSRLVISQQ
ncbi:unnamed protein product [Trichobilharzia szidati]|nr:unnamed protein product [Trichobilharzia szidati]